MSGLLKWDGDDLFLGKTRMARVREDGVDARTATPYDYVVGPDDFISTPYERKDDARQDCERHVRELLRKAGVKDA